MGVESALWYLHSRTPSVVHGDPKSGNVLIVRERLRLQAKVLDFSLSRILTRHARPLGPSFLGGCREAPFRKWRSAIPNETVFLLIICGALTPL